MSINSSPCLQDLFSVLRLMSLCSNKLSREVSAHISKSAPCANLRPRLGTTHRPITALLREFLRRCNLHRRPGSVPPWGNWETADPIQPSGHIRPVSLFIHQKHRRGMLRRACVSGWVRRGSSPSSHFTFSSVDSAPNSILSVSVPEWSKSTFLILI